MTAAFSLGNWTPKGQDFCPDTVDKCEKLRRHCTACMERQAADVCDDTACPIYIWRPDEVKEGALI